MKKTVLLLLTLIAFNSCSIDDDYDSNYHYEILPIESYTVPDSFTLGETYEIKVTYIRPTDCYYFEGFYYDKELNTRTIAIQASVLNEDTCINTLETDPIEVSFDFMVTSNGSYIFKFYKGEDANGEDIFDEIEIPVI